MVFCNKHRGPRKKLLKKVTILILIDGFLQWILLENFLCPEHCHNPYFNRWFSAMEPFEIIVFRQRSHNPYFNRWFSAISVMSDLEFSENSHNPYFNRWFSAI